MYKALSIIGIVIVAMLVCLILLRIFIKLPPDTEEQAKRRQEAGRQMKKSGIRILIGAAIVYVIGHFYFNLF